MSHLSHKNEFGCAPKRWVALHLPSMKRDEAQPSVWGRNQAHFCAINDFGCAPKHLVVLHRGEMKRNPEKMMFSVLW